MLQNTGKTPVKFFVLSLIVLMISSGLNGQNLSQQPSTFWENIQFGGGIGINFGNGFFSGMIAPSAMYRFTPYVATGIGLNAQYSSQEDVFDSTVLGGSVFGLFNPVPEIQISTEFEHLYVSRNFDSQFSGSLENDYWYPALFLGLGYTNGPVTFGIRYDVLYDRDRSIQPEAWMPFVRFWF